MLAEIKKLQANSWDKLDSIQFRVEKDYVDSGLLEIRRGDKVRIKAEGIQSTMVDKVTGEVKPSSESIEFTSSNIAISLAVLEDGMIATITVSLEDKELVKKAFDVGLEGGKKVQLSFY